MRWPASLVAGASVFALIAVAALLGPAIAPYPYDGMDIMARFLPPGAAHWFGTDEFGRDVLSRMLYGGRLSLLMGVGATAVCIVIGVPLGLAAGYYRGGVDETIMRVIDLVISVPPILMGILILSMTPPNPWKTAIAVGASIVGLRSWRRSHGTAKFS